MSRALSYNLAILLSPFLLLSISKMRRGWRRRGHPLSAEYRAYIASPSWRRVSNLARKRAGYRCEHRGALGRCRARSGLATHHLHYRDFGHEWEGNLEGESLKVLCRKHHSAADRKRRRRSR